MKPLDAAMKALPLVAMFIVGWSAHALTHRPGHPNGEFLKCPEGQYPTTECAPDWYRGEPSRGAFVVPQSGIKYVPPGGSGIDTRDTWQCLVAVTGDDPAVWHYRVWREDDPSKALTGKGAVVVPQ